MSDPSSRVVSLKNLLSKHTTGGASELVKREDEDTLRCMACGHRCRIRPGRDGVCRVRFNRDGDLRVPHGYVAGLAVDPVEKKPFYHVMPGTDALSFGMLGCNLHCPFCQNWVTSQTLRDDKAIAEPRFTTAERIVELAVEHRCPVITSTYNEPLISVEWAVEIMKLAKPHGIRGGFVSNGHGTPEVLEYIRPHIDLYKIDLKAFRDASYRELGGVLENVLSTIRRAKQMDFWVEVVTLVVPGLNDSDDEFKQLAGFIADVSDEIPWHVTAFRPIYKMNEPPRTPAETLFRAYEAGRAAGLKYVYAGNLAGSVGERENTHCHACGATLVERYGFQVRRNVVENGNCPDCGAAIPGVWT